MEAVKAGMTLPRRDAPAGLDGGLPGRGVSGRGRPGNGSSDGTGDGADGPAGAEGAEDAEGAAEEETVEGEFKEV